MDNKFNTIDEILEDIKNGKIVDRTEKMRAM